MLTVENLAVGIGERVLLPNFNASWPRGTLVAVLGENGRGKTTLLNHIAGIVKLPAGRVWLGNDDLSTMSPISRAERIASIPQHDSADLETRVADRIAHGLFCRRQRSRLCHAEENELVRRTAVVMKIDALLERPLFALSGGQRKKTHIARCLVDDSADIYVLDEPDASLDADAREHVVLLLKQLSARGKLVVASLHHNRLAESYADIIVNLSQSQAR